MRIFAVNWSCSFWVFVFMIVSINDSFGNHYLKYCNKHIPITSSMWIDVQTELDRGSNVKTWNQGWHYSAAFCGTKY